uniref:Uncharacterized protein n=1 Tax=Triticum urartu TaxID=4572 RepID=A0A8R7U608_TRIUA
MFYGVFIGTDRVSLRSMVRGEMVAKMVSPSNDFSGYGRICGNKGTGMNPA